MASNDVLLHIRCPLVEIFCCRTGIPFAGITIITVGDFLQLPPVKEKPVYLEYKSDFTQLWELFKIADLTEVMQQPGDAEFIDLLNHIHVAEQT